jgi:SAM-dependent methyltransferase
MINLSESAREALRCARISPYSQGGWQLIVDNPLSKADYAALKRVLGELKGEWNRKAQASLFAYDPTVAIANYLETGYIPPKNPHQLFTTQPEDIKIMLDDMIVGLRGFKRILEPSAGTGAIADALRLRCPDAEIDCAEIDAELRAALSNRFPIIGHDFLKVAPTGDYDLVVMNPPFHGVAYQKHVRHAWKFLREAGELLSVVPSAFLFDKKFRNFVLEWGYAESIGSPFEGTDVKCHIIHMTKCEPRTGASVVKSWTLSLDSSNEFRQALRKTHPSRLRALIEEHMQCLAESEMGTFYTEDTIVSLIPHFKPDCKGDDES